jgi:hypothetical protein
MILFAQFQAQTLNFDTYLKSTVYLRSKVLTNFITLDTNNDGQIHIRIRWFIMTI